MSAGTQSGMMTEAVDVRRKPRRVDIWHNILWSTYKASVFTALDQQARNAELDARFFQIAETEISRIALNAVDLSRHGYSYTLVFKGSYEDVSVFKRAWRLGAAVLRTDADLVILAGYSLPENWVQLLILRLRGKKVAVFCDSTVHDRPQTSFKSAFKRFFFANVDGAFCYGDRSREYLRHLGAPDDKIFTRCQAAALPPDYSREKAIADRVARAAKPEHPQFLYVGRLSDEKDLPVLLRAFAIVARKHPTSSLRLAGNGPKRDELVQLARELGIDGQVEFLGGKPAAELAAEYSKATCLVLPSRSEPWGLVVNEAMAQGCPAVVSDVCGCVPELIQPGLTGFSFAVGDHLELAEKMDAAIATFSNARTTAERCTDLIGSFSPQSAAAQIISGILTMLRRPKPAAVGD